MRDALKDLADQFWSGDTVGDGTVGVDVPVVGDLRVGEAREAVVLHNADPSVCTSELPDHALRDLDRTVDDVVLADRVHAVDGQAGVSVETLVSVACISATVATRALSTRQWCSITPSGKKLLERSLGMHSVSVPTQVAGLCSR